MGFRGDILVPITDFDAARQRVEAAASQLLADMMQAHPGHTIPPVDPRWLAEALEIPLFEVSKERLKIGRSFLDGLLMPSDDGFSIFINRDVRSPGRRSFTIAHEIAHTFFSNAVEAAQMRAQGVGQSAVLERLVDIGAAELLMPREIFTVAVDAGRALAQVIPQLREDFGVSLAAAARRYVEVSDEPSAVIFFEDTPKPSGEGPWAYRAAKSRIFRSQDFPFLFPTGKSVPKHSVINRCSLGVKELAAEEDFELGRTQRRLRVSAFPMHRHEGVVGDPPVVVAVMKLL